VLKTIRRSWEKNWPELRAALRRELPGFVTASRAAPLGDAVPVFCYHLVYRAQFEADLCFLERNGYVTIDADTLVAHLRGQKSAPPNAVALTFDDAPANLYHTAYPGLLKHGMVAIAFVAAAFPIDPTANGHGNHAKPPVNGNGHAPAAVKDASSNGHANHEHRPVTWPELKTMQASGLIDVQSHTYQHRYVPRWPEPRELTGIDPEWVEPCRDTPLSLSSDLLLGRRVLERRLNKSVRHLALPDYDGTATALRLAHRLGYASCWWGLMPGRPLNRPGQSPRRIVRLSGEFVRRLPGDGRTPLSAILRRRYAASLQRLRTPR